jgi:hypothetical protein
MGRVLRKKEKESILYQVYCKGTMEEGQAGERAKLFKELSSHLSILMQEEKTSQPKLLKQYA